MGAVQSRLVHKASRRIDMAGGADGDKNICVGQRAVDLIHPQRHFAKPDHVRTQRRRELAAVALVLGGDVAGPLQHLAAPRTAHL